MTLFLAGSLATTALAAEPTDYHGRFTAAEDHVEQVHNKAVEDGASQFNALIRGIARRRLRSSLLTDAWLDIKVVDGTLTIRGPTSNQGVTTPLDGSTVATTTKEGKPATVKRWMNDGVLRTEACNDTGGCTTGRYELDGNSLVVHRETRSPELSSPINYTIRYTRD